MVPLLTPMTPSSPKIRVPYAPRYANGHISATGDPIHFMFGSGYGFQSVRIEWRYFRLHQIHVGGRPPSWIISNGHISATARSIHLYSAQRAVIFAIAQLSCFNYYILLFTTLMCHVLIGHEGFREWDWDQFFFRMTH